MAHSELALILLLGTLSVTVATFLGERTKLWFMTDSGIAIIVGLVLGGIHYIYTLADDVVDDTQQLKLFEFQPGIFTLLLLPPIIFESGYNLNHRSFFANIGPIIIFAFLGTLVAFAVVVGVRYATVPSNLSEGLVGAARVGAMIRSWCHEPWFARITQIYRAWVQEGIWVGFGIGFWVWVIFPGFWRMLQTQISNISRIGLINSKSWSI